MSLETAIQENTAAIRELIAAIAKGMPVAASTVAAVVGETKNSDKPKAETGKKPVATTASSQPGAKPQLEVPKDDAQDGDTTDGDSLQVGGKVITIRAEELAGIKDAKAADGQAHKEYHFAKFAVLALSKHKGRPMVEALLSRFGVQKGPDLKPEQFAEFIKDVDRILTGEYDPEKAEAAEESLA